MSAMLTYLTPIVSAGKRFYGLRRQTLAQIPAQILAQNPAQTLSQIRAQMLSQIRARSGSRSGWGYGVGGSARNGQTCRIGARGCGVARAAAHLARFNCGPVQLWPGSIVAWLNCGPAPSRRRQRMADLAPYHDRDGAGPQLSQATIEPGHN